MKTYKVKIIVRLRQDVLDPQGDSVKSAIDALGIKDIETVRQGKIFDIALQAKDEKAANKIAKDISHKLLINELIETCEIEIEK